MSDTPLATRYFRPETDLSPPWNRRRHDVRAISTPPLHSCRPTPSHSSPDFPDESIGRQRDPKREVGIHGRIDSRFTKPLNRLV